MRRLRYNAPCAIPASPYSPTTLLHLTVWPASMIAGVIFLRVTPNMNSPSSRRAMTVFFPFRSENAKDSPIKDLKEFFHIYPDSPVPDGLEDETRAIYRELVALGTELLSWIQAQTPPDIAATFTMPLDEMMSESQESLLRILHYPPVVAPEPNAIRAAAHEDINLITLLLSGSKPGLQARDAAGVWHDIACDPGMITINNGDMLAMASGNYYPSTTHRVINPDVHANQSRYSMPMFLHPRSDVLLQPGMTADDYLQQRLKEIGLK